MEATNRNKMKPKTEKQTSSIWERIIFNIVLFSIIGYLVYWGYINKLSFESVSLYFLILGLSASAILLLIHYLRKEIRQTQ
jgi:hypothetical protein